MSTLSTSLQHCTGGQWCSLKEGKCTRLKGKGKLSLFADDMTLNMKNPKEDTTHTQLLEIINK